MPADATNITTNCSREPRRVGGRNDKTATMMGQPGPGPGPDDDDNDDYREEDNQE